MDDDLFSPRGHDGRANRHLLDLNAVREFEVVLGYLLREVQILLALNGSEAGIFNGFDAVQPLDALGREREIRSSINDGGRGNNDLLLHQYNPNTLHEADNHESVVAARHSYPTLT